MRRLLQPARPPALALIGERVWVFVLGGPSIVDPRHDIVEGYPSQLMPADFGDRLDDAELQALAAFVTATAGGDGGGGRGRGRGRSGTD
jgi:hypothetical protein